MALVISDEDVRRIFTVEDALETVEEAFRLYGRGLAAGNGVTYGSLPPPKRELRISGKGLPHGGPDTVAIGQGIASLEGVGRAVLQHSFKFRERRGALYHLIDTDTGQTLAIIMDDRFISLMRTAAEGAVAAKYLSRAESKIAGIVGTGRQGRAHLRYLMRVRPIERAYAHSGRRRDDVYAAEVADDLGIDVVAADSVEEVVTRADVVTLVTRATMPLVAGSWLQRGVHVNGMGADCPVKAELDAGCIERADKIVIDSEQVLGAGDLRVPLEQGRLRAERVLGTIGEVVAGVRPGRENESEVTIYKSMGTTLPYVTITARIYDKALKMGLGTDMPTLL